MAWDPFFQTTGRMEPHSSSDGAGICREPSPSLPWHKFLVQMIIEKQKWWKTSIHDNAEPQTAELLLKTIIAVSQLSVCGALAKVVQQ